MQPELRAASRMLIPSTITALRTRRYTSTLYIRCTTRRLDFEPMDGGGRYSIQSPNVSNLSAHVAHFNSADYNGVLLWEMIANKASGGRRSGQGSCPCCRFTITANLLAFALSATFGQFTSSSLNCYRCTCGETKKQNPGELPNIRYSCWPTEQHGEDHKQPEQNVNAGRKGRLSIRK